MPVTPEKKLLNFFCALLICLFFLAAIPRLMHLDAHWNSDESRWLRRSEKFMSAVKAGDFSQTVIAYHPGVMTMWIAGLRTFFTQPALDTINLARARFFIGIAVWIGIGVVSLLLYRLFEKWAALASLTCLAYAPLFLAQTRRVHTDALASVFICLTAVLLLIYCQNRQYQRYLVSAGIAFGLALISKSYALILCAWVPLCLLFVGSDRKNIKLWQWGLKHLTEAIVFVNCAIITVFALWPVFWTPVCGLMAFTLAVFTLFLRKRDSGDKPSTLIWFALLAVGQILVSVHRIVKTAAPVFKKVDLAVTTPHEVEHFFLGEVINDPGWLFYIFVLTIKSTPLILPLAAVGIYLAWRHRKRSDTDARKSQAVLMLLAGAIIFTGCLSITSKKFSRYLLAAFLFLNILAAIGIVEIFRSVGARINAYQGQHLQWFKGSFASAAVLGLFFIQVLPVFSLHPYYGTYYNLCWKLTDITKVITVGEASGLDIAADYLNQKPTPEAITVQVSPLASEFVRNYFRGTAFRANRWMGPNPDYEIVYIRDSQIGRVPQTGDLNGELEAFITLNGMAHVWIYRLPPKGGP